MFYRCNGEVEVVSIGSSENMTYGNAFTDVKECLS